MLSLAFTQPPVIAYVYGKTPDAARLPAKRVVGMR